MGGGLKVRARAEGPRRAADGAARAVCQAGGGGRAPPWGTLLPRPPSLQVRGRSLGLWVATPARGQSLHAFVRACGRAATNRSRAASPPSSAMPRDCQGFLPQDFIRKPMFEQTMLPDIEMKGGASSLPAARAGLAEAGAARTGAEAGTSRAAIGAVLSEGSGLDVRQVPVRGHLVPLLLPFERLGPRGIHRLAYLLLNLIGRLKHRGVVLALEVLEPL
jgi:hypothetical protein